MKRGEIWQADLGYAGKVRPVLGITRRIGAVDEVTLHQVETALKLWLGMTA